ncbi:TIGR02293 family toxin-antitoxin system antitoxin component [Camelimonas fluminis]|uniref:Antitoxin Xre/MbcA/ParS toxin-binding domain-containing protein n=1 Tax=Camelimonas fluminis TaxID=1576911 RepID=A0ABV7UI11_9HYPH|nr:antitoxin Xre/MbcA/ParS toxin-binding domain-containing protein [Camelimonas fluminis]GHE81997.1 TIGR02293 family toxin-antitoxin system antitoxin component [Camelimonas fluminis]
MQVSTLEVLGGDQILGLHISNNQEMIGLLRKGIPVGSIDNMIKSGLLTMAEIDTVVIPRKTLENRRRIGTLTTEQSDRLLRAASVVARAVTVFGSKDKAGVWLRRRTTALSGEAPVSLLDTSTGAEQVLNLLGRIEHGIAA